MTMERIQYFLLPGFGKPHHKSLRLVEEVTGIDLPTTPEDIWQLFSKVTGRTRLTTHFYCRTPSHQDGNSFQEARHASSVYQPMTGWHDVDIFSVSYEDIEVLIDRQVDGEVEVRVWRNGKHEDNPYAKMTFAVYVFICGHCARNDVESAECNQCEFCTNCCPHKSDLSKKVNLTQVYESLEAAIDAVCDRDTQNAIAEEYRKQIRLRFKTDNQKRGDWIAKAQEVYSGIENGTKGGK